MLEVEFERPLNEGIITKCSERFLISQESNTQDKDFYEKSLRLQMELFYRIL